jgi:hypothetical protein
MNPPLTVEGRIMKKFIYEECHLLTNLASLAIILGVVFAVFTVRNEVVKMKADRAQRSASLMLKLDDKLNRYEDIINELDTDDTGFKPIEKFGQDRVEGLIGTYDMIGELAKHDLLLCSMLYNEFSYDIVRACRNPELKAYIAWIRKQDSTLYVNFIDLCDKFRKGGRGCKDQ